MEYVELHCASAFSFLEAGSQPEALIERAANSACMDRLRLLIEMGSTAQRAFIPQACAAECVLIGAEISVSSFGRHVHDDSATEHPHWRRACSALLVAGRLSKSLPTDHAPHVNPQSEGAATLEDIESFLQASFVSGGGEGPLAAALIEGGSRAAHKIIDRRCDLRLVASLYRIAATRPVPRPGVPQPGPACACLLVAATCHCSQWRSLCDSSGPRVVRCAHIHSQSHDARQGRPPAGSPRSNCCVQPPTWLALFRDIPEAHRQHRHRKSAAWLHARQSRL